MLLYKRENNSEQMLMVTPPPPPQKKQKQNKKMLLAGLSSLIEGKRQKGLVVPLFGPSKKKNGFLFSSSSSCVLCLLNASCRRVNIGFIYVGGIDISSFTYIGLLGLVTGIDK